MREKDTVKKQICILGSTGSIGTQALDVISQHPDLYEAYCLTAGSRAELLAEQAHRFRPAAVVIADESKYAALQSLMADMPDVKVYAGRDALCQIVEAGPIDMVVAAMVGFAGLEPTIHAIKAGKRICLANKETLVVAGEIICSLSAQYHAPILPVDSEHSAIFQSIAGDDGRAIRRILLTCSGGPFRGHTAEQLATVTAADALRHPTWTMGAKITIDSATLMNKGFEVIEACWLFGVRPDQIDVLIHPQSIVHSAVEYADGAVKAQLGMPDMRLPIQYAFSFPERLPLSGPRLDLYGKQLEFLRPDTERFPCLRLAYDAMARGGNMPCILNAANEVANAAFREGRCSFSQIAETIERTMQRTAWLPKPDLDAYMATDREARTVAREELGIKN